MRLVLIGLIVHFWGVFNVYFFTVTFHAILMLSLGRLQGGRFRHLLSLLLINDRPSYKVNPIVLVFADDVKIFHLKSSSVLSSSSLS